jgi:hypothetical protein
MREHVATTKTPAAVRRALAKRGLLGDGDGLTGYGRDVCIRLFPKAVQ